MKSLQLVSVISALILSFNSNAIVVNTLNDVQYEWLGLTESLNLNRRQVEAQLGDPNSTLYGYQYASRSMVEDLFYSYVNWDGINGNHSDLNSISGAEAFVTDFGITYTQPNELPAEFAFDTVDGGTFHYDTMIISQGFYGSSYGNNLYGYVDPSECYSLTLTCFATMQIFLLNGEVQAAFMHSASGWDASYGYASAYSIDTPSSSMGSFLVKVSPVPVPSAVWLLGSGLIGIVVFARRKK